MLRKVARFGLRSQTAAPIDDAIVPTGTVERRIDIVAYAEDCILSGRIGLAGDRLSDLLNDNESFELADVLVEDLEGGHAIELHNVVVSRDEMLLVHASGPRGDPARRHRTRQHPIVAKSGPYIVRGYVHALPGTDAIASLRRRKPMIAITDAVIEHTVRSVPQTRRAAVVILNRECTDWIAEGQDEEVVMPELPVDSSGLLLKDFTGQLLDTDPESPA